jgi:hypothetical protein
MPALVALFSRQPALIDAVEVALELAELPAVFLEDPELLDEAVGAVLIDLRDFPDVAELCDAIRARAGQGTPVFLLTTGKEAVRTREEAHEAGADDLFEMPVSAEQVLALLCMVLERPPPPAPTGVIFGAELANGGDDDDVESMDGAPEQLEREAREQALLKAEAAFAADREARERALDLAAQREAAAAREREEAEAESWAVWTHHDAEERARLEAERVAAVEELEQLRAERDEAMAHAEAVAVELEAALDEERLRMASLEAERSSDRGRLDMLESALDDARAKHADTAAELGSVEDERDQLKKELARARADADHARNLVEEARAEIEEAVGDERQRRESASKARDEAVRELRSISAELDELRAARTHADEELKKLRGVRAKLGRVEEDRDAALTELERVSEKLTQAERERDDLAERSSESRSREAEKLKEEIDRLRVALDEERASAADERRALDDRLAEALQRERAMRDDAEARAREAQLEVDAQREKARAERSAIAEVRANLEEDLRSELEAERDRAAEQARMHEAELLEVERRSQEERARVERDARRRFDEELERRMRAVDDEHAEEERQYRAELAEELRAEIEARVEREAAARRRDEDARRSAREARAEQAAERDRLERERARAEQEAALEEDRRALDRERGALEAELRARMAFSTGILDALLVEDPEAAFSGGAAAAGDVGSVPWPEGQDRAIPAGGARFPVDDDEQLEPAPAPAHFVPTDPPEARFGAGEIAAVLWSAHALGVTGALELSDGRGHARTVFLERGEPVGFRSEVARDRPEEALLAAGLITKADYNRLRAGPHLSARRACARLVDEGALKPEELFTAVRGVFTEQLLACLEWDGGQFAYRELSAHPADRLRLTRRFDAILAEGVRRKFDEDRLWHALGGPRTLLGPDDRALRLPAFLPTEVEAARLFDGTRSLEDIILDTGAEPHVVLRVGLALVSARAARVVARGVPMSQEEREARAEQSLDIDRARIRDRVHTARHGDYFEFLGAREDATLQEVRHAASQIRERFAPKRYQAPEFADLRGALEEIIEVCGDAEAVLCDAELRRGYAARLRRKQAALEDTGTTLH